MPAIKNTPLNLGVHTSIAGGLVRAVERAESLGCNGFQIFSRNPRGWQPRPLSRQHIGLGHIGSDAFRNITHTARFRRIPFILETPIDKYGDDERNLSRLQELSAQTCQAQIAETCRGGPPWPPLGRRVSHSANQLPP
jgi:endonuclease IV